MDGLLEPIERMEGLDKLADGLTAVAGRIAPAGPVKDLLSGTMLGHPLHPALTDVAIGAWLSSALLDVAGGPGAEKAADRLLCLGLLSAVPTVATGLSDWGDTWGKARRVGLVHAAVNTAGTLCFGVSLLARRRGARTLGRLLSLAGTGIMTVGGYLGGHLSYRKGVGVDTTTFDEGPGEWTSVLEVGELPEATPTTATAAGVTLLLYRRGDDVTAIADRCSHRGAPLHEGTCDGETVTCPWHASVFRLRDGAIVRGPAVAKQPSYEARISGSTVEVRRAPAEMH
ncbi:MAG: Rieske 2Fe-2S domain-containing protein, partial [Actinomycetota bacterium]